MSLGVFKGIHSKTPTFIHHDHICITGSPNTDSCAHRKKECGSDNVVLTKAVS